MANQRISDLTDGGASLSLDCMLEIELPGGGGSRKITIQQFLEFLGIPVDTLSGLSSPDSGDNYLAFGSDVLKVGESAPGSGSLLMSVDQTGWDRVADNSAAVTS